MQPIEPVQVGASRTAGPKPLAPQPGLFEHDIGAPVEALGRVLGKETAAVRRDEEPTRNELEAQARKLNLPGRSKMGKAELKRTVARAR